MEVNGVWGKYDIFLKVEHDAEYGLDKFVEILRKIENITSTYTMPILFGQGGTIDDQKKKKNQLLPIRKTTFTLVLTSWSDENIGVGADDFANPSPYAMSYIGIGYGIENSDRETAFTPIIL